MPLVKRLTRIGTSSGVILDRAVPKKVELKPDAEVEVAVEDRRIVIPAHWHATPAGSAAANTALAKRTIV